MKSLDELTKKYNSRNRPTKAVIEEDYKLRKQINKDLDNVYLKHDNNKKIKLKEAKKIIDGFLARTTPESLVKDVYQIYLDVQLNQNGQFTATQKESLKTIASICPSEGGQIVYIARGFLSQKDLFDIRDALAICEPNQENLINTREALSVPQQETPVKADFVIYPNPSKESFDINLLESDAGTMQMTDLAGKIVNSFKLRNGTNNIRHNLQNGMYIINVKTDKGKSSTQKLIIRN